MRWPRVEKGEGYEAGDRQEGRILPEHIRNRSETMAYQPIENYGIIGDLHTVALVGMDGSIDWFSFA